MTFEFVESGIVAGGRFILCSWGFGSDGGDLRYEALDKQGGLVEDVEGASAAGDAQIPGASEKQLIWTGWEQRFADVEIQVSGEGRFDVLAYLHRASHGTLPERHRLVGDETGRAFDSDVVIDSFRWRAPQEVDELTISISFMELEPGIASLSTAPPPPPPADVATPDTPPLILSPEELGLIEEFEAAIDGPQPGPAQ